MNKKEFINRIYSSKYINKIVVKFKLLGSKNEQDPYDFLIARLLCLVIIFCFCLYLFEYGYIIGPIAVLIVYYLFNELLLDSKIRKRTQILENNAMHFFEVLTLSLETGRNLVDAINVTTDNVDGLLTDIFKEAVREVSFGKSLSEALYDMQEKIPSDTINNVVLSLTQSNLFGNSVIDNLYAQVDFLREKRKMEVKGRISKIPMLISVISVLFFVPLLLIIILGPLLLEYL